MSDEHELEQLRTIAHERLETIWDLRYALEAYGDEIHRLNRLNAQLRAELPNQEEA